MLNKYVDVKLEKPNKINCQNCEHQFTDFNSNRLFQKQKTIIVLELCNCMNDRVRFIKHKKVYILQSINGNITFSALSYLKYNNIFNSNSYYKQLNTSDSKTSHT